MKISNCYSSLIDDVIEVDEMQKLQIENRGLFNELTSNLLCPSCHQARLTYKSGTIKQAHFSTWPNSAHDEDCPLKQANRRSYSGQKLTDHEDINVKAKLANLLEKLQRKSLRSNFPILSGDKDIPQNGNNSCLKKLKRVETFSVKKITSPFLDSDLGYLKLFYGQACVTYADFCLRLKNPNNKKYLCSIIISDKVKKYLREDFPHLLEAKEALYNIAFFGEMNQNSKGFYELVLHKSYYLNVIKEVWE